MGEKTVDMTKGSILPKMIRFALPVLLGMLFQRIYNFVDVYIVGRYLVDEALADRNLCFFYLRGGCIYADHYNCGTDRGAAASEDLADLE